MIVKANRVYTYSGRDRERAPKRTKKVIIANCVTVIKTSAFNDCTSSLKCVSNMHGNITEIEHDAFFDCKLLRYIALPRNLECIGSRAFYGCRSLEVIFLPPSLRRIEDEAFGFCSKLKIFCIPDTVQELGEHVIRGCVRLMHKRNDTTLNSRQSDGAKEANNCRDRYEKYPLHKLCYSTNVTFEEINQCIQTYGRGCASVIDDQQMTAMHVIASNPYATSEIITAIYNANPKVATVADKYEYNLNPVHSTVWKWILESPKEYKHMATCRSNIDNGMKHGIITDKYGSTTLHLLCEYNPCLLGDLEWLEKSTCCFGIQNKAGKTPLQILMKNGNITQLPIGVALKYHVKWEDGMKCILESTLANDANCLLEKDAETGLYLFMLAAVGDNSNLTTIYELLLLNPDLLRRS